MKDSGFDPVSAKKLWLDTSIFFSQSQTDSLKHGKLRFGPYFLLRRTSLSTQLFIEGIRAENSGLL
jgi:hypothetical protein